ncbi:MAG: hypothetical protein HQL08_10250 [Nitrospirae bacterium]|nr:hypothetical protein [Nitrospirota bacterium]
MIIWKRLWKMIALSISVLALSVLAGCGGGSGGTGSSSSNSSASVSNTIINGLASKGPIANGTVSIYAISNGQMGNVLASTTTGSNGSFMANLGAYNGAMMVQVTGGSYIDEATNKTVQMGSMMLRTAVSNAAGNVTVAVTPITEMAVQYMGTLTSQDMIDLSNNMMGSKFGISDIVHTLPQNVTGSNSAANNSSQTYYGLMLAAMSQAAASNNISMSTLMSTIANSLKDTSSTGSQTLTSMMSLMSQSFINFQNSTNNKTGVTTMSPGGIMSTLGGMMGNSTGNSTGASNNATGTTGSMMGNSAGNSAMGR